MEEKNVKFQEPRMSWSSSSSSAVAVAAAGVSAAAQLSFMREKHGKKADGSERKKEGGIGRTKKFFPLIFQALEDN